jgi:predicted esterase
VKKLHILIAALLAALTLLPFSATPAEAHSKPVPSAHTFSLNAKVLDGGQQIVSLTIRTGRLGIKASSLSTSTFSVKATGTNPYTSLDPATVFGTFKDVQRTVTGVHLDRQGNIVIDLAYGFTTPGAFTFAWANSEQRNIMLDLTYSITQNQPVKLWGGKDYTFSALKQGRVMDPEVDAFGSGRAAGMVYRIYKPKKAAEGKRPLIIWLHGGGEGGWSQAYNNDLPLIANRGALGFITPKAQRIFGGAYVLAPQANDYWLNDAAQGYSARLKKLIDKVVRNNPRIDRNRIYVTGASNGGYMAPKLVVDNPKFFAAEVPIAPALLWEKTPKVFQRMISDAQLASIKTPTWVVQSKDDLVLPFPANGQHMAATIPGSLLTAYDNVTWDGVTYNGHWSWIYVARNDPKTDSGLHIWQWMAKQHLASHHHHR